MEIDLEAITAIRAYEPERIHSLASNRVRRPFVNPGEKLMIVAADHTARGIVSAGSDPSAMADRKDMLERLVTALSFPEVDGVLASADILEDLLILGSLENKVVMATMNRAGIKGSTFEFDDRFAAYSALGIEKMGFDAGKMLCRICLNDSATPNLLENCARAINELSERGITAIIEPFISSWQQGVPVNDLSTNAVITSAVIGAGLGGSSVRTWLKLPVVERMEQVIESTMLPVLLLGGDSRHDRDQMYASWESALKINQVKGLIVGRNALYPSDGDYTGAIMKAASLVHPKRGVKEGHEY